MCKKLWNFHSHKSGLYRIVNIDYTELENYINLKSQYYTFGLHPWFIETDNVYKVINSFEIVLEEKLNTNLSTESKLISIGECGLDRLKGPSLSVQIGILIELFRLAQHHQLPIILHCVRAYPELIQIIKKYFKNIHIAVHGFNAGIQEANTLLKYGVKLSFGQSLLYSQKIQNIFSTSSIDSIFIETDDSNVRLEQIYSKAAEIKNISISVLIEQIQKNIFNFFALS